MKEAHNHDNKLFLLQGRYLSVVFIKVMKSLTDWWCPIIYRSV